MLAYPFRPFARLADQAAGRRPRGWAVMHHVDHTTNCRGWEPFQSLTQFELVQAGCHVHLASVAHSSRHVFCDRHPNGEFSLRDRVAAVASIAHTDTSISVRLAQGKYTLSNASKLNYSFSPSTTVASLYSSKNLCNSSIQGGRERGESSSRDPSVSGSL